METTMTATRIDRGSTATTTIYSEGGDLVFERTFDAPRELVWKAFTDPEIVPRWWGPHGTTTTVVEMDVRPGGSLAVRQPRRRPRGRRVLRRVPRDRRRPSGFTLDVHVRRPGRRPAGRPRDPHVRGPRRPDARRSVSEIGSAEDIEAALAAGMVEGGIETWDRLSEFLTEG